MNNILKVIKDFWSVMWRIDKTTDQYISFSLFGSSIGACLVCINDYNTLGLTGWLIAASYWFIEIAKLNNRDNNLIQ
jgi:hypothetical protein